jgi:hypothetical protein
MLLQLFNYESVVEAGVSKDPNTDFVMRSYKRELDKVVDYYRHSTFRVDPTSILIRLMYLIATPLDYEDDVYTRVVTSKAPNIARALRITSSVSFGQFHKPSFYNEDSRELYTYIDTYIYPFGFQDIYKTVASVRVIQHNESSISFTAPKNGNRSNGEGLVNIEINIPMLALQYKCYAREMEINGLNVSYEQFISRIVLPNMLASHIDYAIMNRAIAQYYGKPYTANTSQLPFPVIDYEGRLDKLIQYAMKHTKNRSMKYYDVLRHYPSVVNTSQLESLQLPLYVPNRQLLWNIFYSRLDVMMFLIDSCGEETRHYNSEEIEDLKRLVRRFQSDNIYRKMLDQYEQYELNDTFDRILAFR